MQGIQNDTLRFVLAEQWHELAASDVEAEAHNAAIIESFDLDDENARRNLEAGLRAVTRIAFGLPQGVRTSHALVLHPASGRVEALLSARLSRVTPEGFDNYLVAARALQSDESTEVIRRAVDEVTIPAARAVLSSDFTLPLQREGVVAPAMERAFLAVFPEGYETVVEFALFTQNLALFENAGDFLVGLASGRTIDPEAEAP